MKRLIDRRYLYLILLSFALLFSCKDVINQDVIDIPTDKNAITAAPDVDKALAAAYSFLREVVPDKVFLMGDMRANVFSSYDENFNAMVETPIAKNLAIDLLKNNGGDWNGFYRVIAQCNLILEKIPTIAVYDQETRKKHIGEASFLRALSYFYLARFWGDVPINLKAVNLDNIPKSSQADVFKQINIDLNTAIANLNISYATGDNAIRATKGAAWAIKAHVMGWLQDFSACEKLCDSVITLGQYRLVTDTNNLVSIFAGQSPEGIFELNFDVAAKEVQRNRIYYRTLGRPWYQGAGNADEFILSPTSAQMNEMFVPGSKDARRFSWFIKEAYGKSFTVTTPKGTGTYNGLNRYYFGKYRTLQFNGDTTSQNINESNIIITRLADIMLLRAEALANPSIGRTTEAITLLNAVRDRAKAQPYTGGGNLQDTILLERKKELIGEGQYFFDLVRNRKVSKYTKIKQTDWFEKGAWLLPIDQSIIVRSNYAITQNEYWR